MSRKCDRSTKRIVSHTSNQIISMVSVVAVMAVGLSTVVRVIKGVNSIDRNISNGGVLVKGIKIIFRVWSGSTVINPIQKVNISGH